MEPTVVAVIILIALAGGVVAMLSRQGLLPASVPMPRLFGAGAPFASKNLSSAKRSDVAELAPTPEQELAALHDDRRPAAFPGLMAEREFPQHREPALVEVPSSPGPLTERLAQLEDQVGDLRAAIEQQSRELDRLRADLLARAEAAEARRDAALERMRADLLASLTNLAGERPRRMALDRRVEASADLFARLARLESALSAVSNPILLPGEDYLPPAELLPESLVWDNWSEVGERAFALADAYSAQRLSLSVGARDDVGQFVTALRLLLTRSVYPNLQDDPDATQQAALRTSLEEIAAELPKVRAALDREYQGADAP